MTADSDYTLFHNPRCSKSRAVKALLEERGVSFAICHYLEDPLTADDLRGLMRKLALKTPRGITRTKEPIYGELGGNDLGDDELIEAMLQHRVLIERPILIRGDRAVIGRPPENAEQLLDG